MTERAETGFPRNFLLSFAMWATLAFVAAWFLHPPWQRAIGAMAARLAAPRGQSIEMMDLELFYPFDIGVYVALCLASSWAPLPRRGRAIVMGLPVLVVIEIVSVVASIKAMISMSDPAQAERFFDGIVRVSGLVAASAAWLVLLGRERLSLAAAAVARQLERGE